MLKVEVHSDHECFIFTAYWIVTYNIGSTLFYPLVLVDEKCRALLCPLMSCIMSISPPSFYLGFVGGSIAGAATLGHKLGGGRSREISMTGSVPLHSGTGHCPRIKVTGTQRFLYLQRLTP